MHVLRTVTSVAIVALVAAGAPAAIIESNFNGTSTSLLSYFGQSFTVSAAGAYNNITMNFWINYFDPVASGNLYLFTAEYDGTPAGLAASAYAGKATASGGIYTFAPSLTLTGGSKYYAYTDTALRVQGEIHNPYGGGELAWTANADQPFMPDLGFSDVNFIVYGTASAVPEVSSWAMFIGGFGLIGASLRWRQRISVGFSAAKSGHSAPRISA